MMNSLSKWLVQWRWLLMPAALILIFGLISGGRFIQFAADYEVWFSDDNPQLNDFLKLQRTYNKSDNVVFLITPKNGNVFTQETLSSVEWLTEKAWQIPFSTRVDSITNFQHTYASGDDLVVVDLVRDASSLSNLDLGKVENIALSEPLLVNRAISRDSKVTAVNVTINLPKNTPEGSPIVTAFARDLIVQLKEINPNIDMHLTGLVVMDNAFMETSQKDMGSLTPIMFLVILVGLGILLRSVTGTISILFVIVLSIVATMGFSGWLGVKLTPISANATTIVMTVAVANTVHILLAFIHSMRAGMSKRSAIEESLRINIQPVSLAAITTIIGFMSMHFSDIPPFHDLGNMVAVGVVVTYILSFTFIPWFLMLFPVRVATEENYKNRHMTGFSNFVIKQRKKILISTSIITIFFIAFIPNNQVNEEISKYFDETIDFRVDTDYASEHLTGPYYLEYSLKTDKPGGISDPTTLKTIDNFKEWLKDQPEVVHVNSITDIIKRLNKNMHNDDPAWYRIPDNHNLVAQYILLYEMSLPYGLDLNNQLNVDKSGTRVVASLHNQSTLGMISFNQRAKDWVAQHAPGIELTSGSPQYMFSHIGQRTVQDMAIGISVALALISLLIMFALRSFKIGLISLIPNLAPPAIAFGVWGIFNGLVGFSLAVGIGMTIGIIVDDTVHFLSKYLRARREKELSPEEAVRYAFSNVGAALMITTAVLVAGFMVLTFSAFKMNVDMGIITALTIFIALVLDFLLLPALLLTLDKNYEPAIDNNIALENIN